MNHAFMGLTRGVCLQLLWRIQGSELSCRRPLTQLRYLISPNFRSSSIQRFSRLMGKGGVWTECWTVPSGGHTHSIWLLRYTGEPPVVCRKAADSLDFLNSR